MHQDKAIRLTLEERARQSARFGAMPNNNDPLIWIALIMEELGEALKELQIDSSQTGLMIGLFAGELIELSEKARYLIDNKPLREHVKTRASHNYHLEMIQVAALAIAALEDFQEDKEHGDPHNLRSLDDHR